MRIDYFWTRYKGGVNNAKQHDYAIDRNADGMTKISEVLAYLREFAKNWTGVGSLEIIY